MAVITKENRNDDFKEIGKQFAYEGLDESYLKDPTPMELAQFRIGYKEAMQEINVPSTRNDDFVVSNESRMMHR